jgi:hypothetical protein
MIDAMLTDYVGWGAQELWCEENVAFTLIQPLLRRMAADRKISVNYHPFKSSTATSKAYKIRAIMPYFQSGRIRISDDQQQLLGELARYPKDKDDLVDALATAIANLCPKEIPNVISIEEAVQRHKDKMDRDWPEPKRSDNFFINVFGA